MSAVRFQPRTSANSFVCPLPPPVDSGGGIGGVGFGDGRLDGRMRHNAQRSDFRGCNIGRARGDEDECKGCVKGVKRRAICSVDQFVYGTCAERGHVHQPSLASRFSGTLRGRRRSRLRSTSVLLVCGCCCCCRRRRSYRRRLCCLS
jgi:hypothetical protein